MVWSEEYYKSKALSTLQRLFQYHYECNGRNPKLADLYTYLDDPETFAACLSSDNYPKKMAEKAEAKERPDQGHAVTAAVLKSLHLGHTPTYTLLYTYHVCTDTYIYIIYAHVAASRSHSCCAVLGLFMLC